MRSCTVRGGFRILGGVVQVAAGITRLVAVAAIEAAVAVEGAVVEATESEEEEPDSKRPKVAHPAALDESQT